MATQPIELPGTSFFLRDGDEVYLTNSTYARGAEMTGGSYYWLDLTALGRQEDVGGAEGPLGRQPRSRAEVRAYRTEGSPSIGPVHGWWQQNIVDSGKWPLMLCFVAFVVTFLRRA